VPHDRRPARLGWIPELVAVAALLALLVAAVWVFTTEAEAAQTTRRTPSSAEASAPATARRPASASSAAGTLEGCVRRGSVVEVTVAVEHRSGPPSAFEVTASLVDDAGSPTATGRATTAVVAPGATADVTVPIEGRGVQGATCELVRVGSV
jgi:hypothetical protein